MSKNEDEKAKPKRQLPYHLTLEGQAAQMAKGMSDRRSDEEGLRRVAELRASVRKPRD